MQSSNGQQKDEQLKLNQDWVIPLAQVSLQPQPFWVQAQLLKHVAAVLETAALKSTTAELAKFQQTHQLQELMVRLQMQQLKQMQQEPTAQSQPIQEETQEQQIFQFHTEMDQSHFQKIHVDNTQDIE
jgi:hypothetical protein